jgi:hypothetical protein
MAESAQGDQRPASLHRGVDVVHPKGLIKGEKHGEMVFAPIAPLDYEDEVGDQRAIAAVCIRNLPLSQPFVPCGAEHFDHWLRTPLGCRRQGPVGLCWKAEPIDRWHCGGSARSIAIHCLAHLCFSQSIVTPSNKYNGYIG